MEDSGPTVSSVIAPYPREPEAPASPPPLVKQDGFLKEQFPPLQADVSAKLETPPTPKNSPPTPATKRVRYDIQPDALPPQCSFFGSEFAAACDPLEPPRAEAWDVKDLSLCLLGAFAIGATTAGLFAWSFSKRTVIHQCPT
jgi:hypothetical protein